MPYQQRAFKAKIPISNRIASFYRFDYNKELRRIVIRVYEQNRIARMDETDRIRQFMQGDADALSALVDGYRKPLFSFILHMVAGKDDADEIFQEV